MSKIAKNLRAFAEAIQVHDRQNPDHQAYGIGLAAFDIDRLGLEDGEEILPGITVQCDGRTSGNFRVLCEANHGTLVDETAREEVVA